MNTARGTVLPSAEADSHVGDVHDSCSACAAVAVPADARFCPFCGSCQLVTPLLFDEVAVEHPSPATPEPESRAGAAEPLVEVGELVSISDIVVLRPRRSVKRAAVAAAVASLIAAAVAASAVLTHRVTLHVHVGVATENGRVRDERAAVARQSVRMTRNGIVAEAK